MVAPVRRTQANVPASLSREKADEPLPQILERTYDVAPEIVAGAKGGSGVPA